jgi:putative ABC transport system substrate-binding protein
MGNPVNVVNWNAVEESTRSLRITPHLLDVRRAEDLPTAFAEAVKRRAEALFVGVDGTTQGNLRLIADLAIQRHLPSIYGAKEYVGHGGLMTYGANDARMYHRAATFVDRIFRGSRPADLPVEQPSTFELALNLKTAKVLGLTIPPELMQRADHVIE